MYLDLNKTAELYHADYKRFQKDEYHVTRISRDDILLLMLGGTLYFTEDGAEISLSQGEYYVQRKGREQSALRPSNDAYYIYFHFSGSWCEEEIHGLPPRGRFDTEKIFRPADRLFRRMKLRNKPALSNARVFYEILEQLLEENRRLDDGLLLAEKIHGYISENFSGRVDVADIADFFSYSPDYIIRVFKRAYGVTPHSYLTSCRVEYAKLLLSTTNKPIGEIAEDSGYPDFTTFYRAFRKHTNHSPKEWRES